MASVKLVLRKKRKEQTQGTVYVRITESRKSRYVSTGVKVAERDWNERKGEVRKGHPQSRVYNSRLEEAKHEAEAALFELQRSKKGRTTAEAVKREIQGEGTSHFFPYAAAYAQEQEDRGKYWEWRKVNVLIGKVEGYHGSRDLSFPEVDLAFIVGLDKYMRTVLGNKANTRAKNHQILQRIIKRAVRDGLIGAANNPYPYFEVKTEPTTKEKLSLDEIRALEALDLPPGSMLAVARDAFIFSFYAAGIRFGDLARLRWRDVEGGRLSYRMAKTGKPKSVLIPAPAAAILDRYRDREGDPFVFPLLHPDIDLEDGVYVRRRISSHNVRVNKALKELARRIGTKAHVSFHVSRHSFADYARRQSNGDIYAISKALGHSKLQTTQTYLKSFDEDAVDNLMSGLFEGALGKTERTRRELGDAA